MLTLSEEDRATLEQRARGYSAARHAQVVRAKIVLAAAQGAQTKVIAERLGIHVDVVSRWRKRFCAEGIDGLKDRKRSGRPRVFAAKVVAGIKAMVCEPPAARDVPLSRWSSTELADQAVAEGLVEAVSASTVRRWLADKAGRVLDLYARVWDGEPLGPDDYVISADENSQLQALSRVHPELRTGPGRPRRVEFEYDRGGTLAYMGAYDVHRAKAHGHHRPYTGIARVRRAGEQGDDHRTLRQRREGVVGGRQRRLSSGQNIYCPDGPDVADRHAGPPCRCMRRG